MAGKTGEAMVNFDQSGYVLGAVDVYIYFSAKYVAVANASGGGILLCIRLWHMVRQEHSFIELRIQKFVKRIPTRSREWM